MRPCDLYTLPPGLWTLSRQNRCRDRWLSFGVAEQTIKIRILESIPQTRCCRHTHSDLGRVSTKLAGLLLYTEPDDVPSGGIRGIVELEILRQVEKAMGGRLAIQCFFELIVGTRSGVLLLSCLVYT